MVLIHQYGIRTVSETLRIMAKKVVNSVKHVLAVAGKNWMEAMRYYSLQM